jgi:hypothetical protein
VILRVVSVVAAARRRAAEGEDADRAARTLALAVRGAPDELAGWAAAMQAELASVSGIRARWGFSLGCSRAVLILRARRALARNERGGNPLRVLAHVAIACCAGLVIFGLVRYPELHHGTTAWFEIVSFALLLAGYAATSLVICRGVGPGESRARTHAALGGVAIGAAWLLILAPEQIGKQLVALPLLVALLTPCAVALVVALRTGDRRAATAAALWSGMLGALVVFIVWVAATLVRDGRPYDAQLVRDYHASGAHDLAAYAVGDTLGSAVGLLVIVPLVALALGSLVAALATRLPRPAAGTPAPRR